MQRLLTQLASALLLAFFASVAAVHANDISIYPAPYNSLGSSQNATDPTQTMHITDVDVWGRIRKGFGIPNLQNPLVTSQTEWYSSRPDYIQRTTTRASRYLYHVVEELEKRGMPTELALLPFIESAFNPQAYSTAKAAGMWQFIPSTGLDYNLAQNMFTDDRRDVLASTDAALTYLQKLYGMFGDWQLALAAYNWGEGSVQRAIKRQEAAGLPTDYNSLSPLMPVETRNYYPKLQAVKNIIAAPSDYNITLPIVDNQPYFVTIGNTRNIDVKIAAQLAELSVDEFKELNPQFKRPVIIGGEDAQIILPESNAEKFKTNLGKWTQALSSWTSHTVLSARERIETIASKFHTSPEVIRSVNQIPPKMVLRAGSTILVPRMSTEATSIDSDITQKVAENAKMLIAPDEPDTKRIFVHAGKRDTLAGIAKLYHVTVMQVKEWNSLHRDVLSNGQRLTLEVPYRSSYRGVDRVVQARSHPVAQRRVAAAAPIRVHAMAKKGNITLVSERTSRKN
ncbi:MAG: lytic transglycosylase [Herbaspirillum sp.]|nr:lytic transglycosylase [Herbaspirillum sp.]